METQKFNEGDKVEFTHLGEPKTGTVLVSQGDGRIRIKDARGYIFRYQPENVYPVGGLHAAPIIEKEIENQPINQPIKTEPMAKKEKVAPQVEAAVSPSKPAIDTKKIAALTCKKHQRIFLLMEAGCDKGEIMKAAGCNAGEISNVKTMYAAKPERVAEAKALLVK